MRRILTALAALYHRWRFVEDVAPERRAHSASSDSEPQRLRRALERDERLIADYRRQGCLSLAKEREASARALRSRLMILGS